MKVSDTGFIVLPLSLRLTKFPGFNKNRKTMKQQIPWKKILPHVCAVVLFALLSLAYFGPVVFGDKSMGQGDVYSWTGQQKENARCVEETGSGTDWTNVSFGGMPTVGSEGYNVYNRIFHKVVMGGLPRTTAGILFFYMVGVYILLCVLGCSPWLAVMGAAAYALSTYNIVIIDAGHANKCWAMACMAPILAGVILSFRGRYLWGCLLILVFAGLHIMYSHQQITYYLLIMLVAMAVAYAVQAFRQKSLGRFWKGGVLAVAMAIVSILPSLGGWLVTYDYSKETMRGGAVLKENPQGENEGTGLDIDYAFQWSYGKMESFTVLVPGLYGGSSHYKLSENAETYQLLRSSGQTAFAENAPLYWGDQPFTSGPVYVGAVICFLFILGLFVVKGPDKWWLLAVTVISFLLSWGRHLPWLNDFLFYHLPLYNRFRTPSMALVIAELSMVVLAALAVKTLLEDKTQREKFRKDFFYAWGITGGLALFFVLFGKGMFDFSSAADAQYPDWLSEALRADRAGLLVNNALHSLVFILLAGLAVGAYMKAKIKDTALTCLLAFLVVVDLWVIDRHYVGPQNFHPRRSVRAVIPTEADKLILADPDPNFRVFNATVNTFNDASTSNFHKSIGGYSPMKLRRYQDIIDFHFSQGINVKVLNMLNTKYFIVPDRNGQAMVQRNVSALGNAWFVDSVRWVGSPDEEIRALYDFDPSRTAVIDREWEERVGSSSAIYPRLDSLSTVRLVEYRPNYLKYEYASTAARPLVFSEVYHKTWKAFVDGTEVPLYRVDYILRALSAPAGDHVVELKCRNRVKAVSGILSNAGSVLSGMVILLIAGLLIRKARKGSLSGEEKASWQCKKGNKV